MRRDPDDLIPLAYRRYKAVWLMRNGISYSELGDAFRAFIDSRRERGERLSGWRAVQEFEAERRMSGKPIWLGYRDFISCIFTDPEKIVKLLSAEDFSTYCLAWA